jgi:hypothetical protein
MAQVEQVFEQVASPIPFATATSAEVEQVRPLLAWQSIGKDTAIEIISFDPASGQSR